MTGTADVPPGEDAKALYVRTMGKPLGAVFHALWQDVVWLHAKWHEYVRLYGTDQRRLELLNRAAPWFFRVVQDALWEQVLLHLARLTASQRSCGHSNLTLSQLAPLVDDGFRQEVRDLLGEAVRACEFCKDWRDRRIAHNDLALAMGQPADPLKPASRKAVREALAAIAKVLDTVALHYGGSVTAFDFPVVQGGAESLLYFVDLGLRARRERRHRLHNGLPKAGD